MLRQLMIVILGALILAGCNNNNVAPTQAVQNTSGTPAADATAAVPLPTNGPREYGTEEVALPIPGTLIAPVTEEPGAGQPFSQVILNRSGGLQGTPLDVILSADGTLIRNGATSTVSPDVVTQINQMLDQMGFFGMQGVFQGIGTSADVFTYNITVEKPSGAARTVTAQDGYIPPELAALLQVLQGLGES
ncbi:MAG: hypothetical protein LCI00_25400 [Chloroflexi bacterium]|nr:hypothetical protein [Chloroflexota bacterium]MCC6894931.1 hypothetical protein [Anaerolineae bacterium]